MSHPEPSGPELDGVVAAANAVGLPWPPARSRARSEGSRARFASLRSIVGFKRLAGRPQDRRDLEELEALNGELPKDEIPGLDR